MRYQYYNILDDYKLNPLKNRTLFSDASSNIQNVLNNAPTISPIKNIFDENTNNIIKSTILDLRDNSPIATRLLYNPKAYTSKQTQNLYFDYNDPYQINSLMDIVVSGVFDPLAPNRKKMQAYNWGIINNIPILATLPALATYFNEGYIKPFVKGDMGAFVLNNLTSFGQDADILAKLVKAPVISAFKGENPFYGLAKAYGLSAEGGVHNYDYDLNSNSKVDGVLNFMLEVVSDPLNWFTLGAKGAFTSATKKSVTEIFEGIAKTAGTYADNINYSKIAAQGIRGVLEGDEKILRQAYMQLVGSTPEAINKAIASGAPDFIKFVNNLGEVSVKANRTAQHNTLAGLSKIIKPAEAVDKAILKASLALTPVGLGYNIVKKGQAIRNGLKTNWLRNLIKNEAFITDPTGNVDIVKYSEMKQRYAKLKDTLPDEVSEQLSDTVVDDAVIYAAYTQLSKVSEEMTKIFSDTKIGKGGYILHGLEDAKAFREKLDEIKQGIGKINGINAEDITDAEVLEFFRTEAKKTDVYSAEFIADLEYKLNILEWARFEDSSGNIKFIFDAEHEALDGSLSEKVNKYVRERCEKAGRVLDMSNTDDVKYLNELVQQALKKYGDNVLDKLWAFQVQAQRQLKYANNSLSLAGGIKELENMYANFIKGLDVVDNGAPEAASRRYHEYIRYLQTQTPNPELYDDLLKFSEAVLNEIALAKYTQRALDAVAENAPNVADFPELNKLFMNIHSSLFKIQDTLKTTKSVKSQAKQLRTLRDALVALIKSSVLFQNETYTKNAERLIKTIEDALKQPNGKSNEDFVRDFITDKLAKIETAVKKTRETVEKSADVVETKGITEIDRALVNVADAIDERAARLRVDTLIGNYGVGSAEAWAEAGLPVTHFRLYTNATKAAEKLADTAATAVRYFGDKNNVDHIWFRMQDGLTKALESGDQTWRSKHNNIRRPNDAVNKAHERLKRRIEDVEQDCIELGLARYGTNGTLEILEDVAINLPKEAKDEALAAFTQANNAMQLLTNPAKYKKLSRSVRKLQECLEQIQEDFGVALSITPHVPEHAYLNWDIVRQHPEDYLPDAPKEIVDYIKTGGDPQDAQGFIKFLDERYPPPDGVEILKKDEIPSLNDFRGSSNALTERVKNYEKVLAERHKHASARTQMLRTGQDLTSDEATTALAIPGVWTAGVYKDEAFHTIIEKAPIEVLRRFVHEDDLKYLGLTDVNEVGRKEIKKLFERSTPRVDVAKGVINFVDNAQSIVTLREAITDADLRMFITKEDIVNLIDKVDKDFFKEFITEAELNAVGKTWKRTTKKFETVENDDLKAFIWNHTDQAFIERIIDVRSKIVRNSLDKERIKTFINLRFDTSSQKGLEGLINRATNAISMRPITFRDRLSNAYDKIYNSVILDTDEIKVSSFEAEAISDLIAILDDILDDSEQALLRNILYSSDYNQADKFTDTLLNYYKNKIRLDAHGIIGSKYGRDDTRYRILYFALGVPEEKLHAYTRRLVNAGILVDTDDALGAGAKQYRVIDFEKDLSDIRKAQADLMRESARGQDGRKAFQPLIDFIHREAAQVPDIKTKVADYAKELLENYSRKYGNRDKQMELIEEFLHLNKKVQPTSSLYVKTPEMLSTTDTTLEKIISTEVPALTEAVRYAEDVVIGDEIIYGFKFEQIYSNIFLATDASYRAFLTDVRSGDSLIKSTLSRLETEYAASLSGEEQKEVVQRLAEIKQMINTSAQQDYAYGNLVNYFFNNADIAKATSPEMRDAVFSAFHFFGKNDKAWYSDIHKRQSLYKKIFNKANSGLYSLLYKKKNTLDVFREQYPDLVKIAQEKIGGSAHTAAFDAAFTYYFLMQQDHKAFNKIKKLLNNDKYHVLFYDLETTGLKGYADDIKDAALFNPKTKEAVTFYGQTKQYPSDNFIINTLAKAEDVSYTFEELNTMTRTELREQYDRFYNGLRKSQPELAQKELIQSVLKEVQDAKASGKEIVFVGYNNKSFDDVFFSERIDATYAPGLQEAKQKLASGSISQAAFDSYVKEWEDAKDLWASVRQYDVFDMVKQKEGIPQLTANQKRCFSKVFDTYLDNLPENTKLIQPVNTRYISALQEYEGLLSDWEKRAVDVDTLAILQQTQSFVRQSYQGMRTAKKSISQTNRFLSENINNLVSNKWFVTESGLDLLEVKFGQRLLNMTQALYYAETESIANKARRWGYKKIYDESVAREYFKLDDIVNIHDLRSAGKLLSSIQHQYNSITNSFLINQPEFTAKVSDLFDRLIPDGGSTLLRKAEDVDTLAFNVAELDTRQKLAIMFALKESEMYAILPEEFGVSVSAVRSIWGGVDMQDDISAVFDRVYQYPEDALDKAITDSLIENISFNVEDIDTLVAKDLATVEDIDTLVAKDLATKEKIANRLNKKQHIIELRTKLEQKLKDKDYLLVKDFDVWEDLHTELREASAALKTKLDVLSMHSASLGQNNFFRVSEQVRMVSGKELHNLLTLQEAFVDANKTTNPRAIEMRIYKQRAAQKVMQAQQTLLGLDTLTKSADEIISHLIFRAKGRMVINVNAYKHIPGFSEAFNKATENLKGLRQAGISSFVENDCLYVGIASDAKIERFSKQGRVSREWQQKQLQCNETVAELTRRYDAGELSEKDYYKKVRQAKKLLNDQPTEYGVYYLFNGKEVQKPVLRQLDYDAIFEVFEDSDAEFVQAMRATMDKNHRLIGDAAVGSSQEFISNDFIEALYSLPPEKASKDMLSGVVLREVLPQPDVAFNHSILGDANFRRNIFKDTDYAEQAYISVGTDVFNSTTAMATWAYNCAEKRSHYLQLFWDDAFKLTDDGLFKNCSDEQIVRYLKDNPDYKVVICYDTGKPSTEFGIFGSGRVTEISINKVADLERARQLNAIVLPYQTYSKLSEVVNSSLYKNQFIRNMERLNYMFKVGWLSKPGNWVRNIVDAFIHNLIESQDPVGMAHSYKEAIQLYGEYTNIIKALLEESNGEPLTRTMIIEHFARRGSEGMSLEMFQKLHGLYEDGPANQSRALTKAYLKGKGPTSFDEILQGTSSESGWAMFVESTRLCMMPNEYIEQISRTAEYLWAIKNGYTDVSAYSLVAKTHFDYSIRTSAEELMGLVIPFYTYTMRNMTYWLDALERMPWLARAYSDYMNYSYNFDEINYDELQYDRKRVSAMLSGNYAFGDLELKLNPSLADAYNMLANPLGSWKQRLAPYIQTALNALGVNNADSYNWFTGIFGTGEQNRTRVMPWNLFKNLVPIGGAWTPEVTNLIEIISAVGNLNASLSQTQNWDLIKNTLQQTGLQNTITVGQFANAMAKIPEVSASATHLQKQLNERTATVLLSKLVPSLFGDIHKEPYTPKQYTKKLYSNTKRKGTGTYKRKPYNRRPYAKKTYAKKSYTKKSWAKKSYVSNVYARKSYDRKVYAKNLWHNRYQSRQVGLYNRLYTKKGRARLDTMFAPKTKGLQYSIINTNIFYRR